MEPSRFHIHFSRCYNPRQITAFYLIPTIFYVRLINDNRSIIIFFGDLFLEFVWLSPEGLEEMKDRLSNIGG